MNLSLRGRVTASFIIATMVVLTLTFVVFHYLDSLNKEVEDITSSSGKVSILTDEIRISAVSLLKYQRQILTNKPTPKQVEKIIDLCSSFTSQLQRLDDLFRDPDVKKVVGQMLAYVDALKLDLSKGSIYNRGSGALAKVGDLADKILDSFSEFQDIQYFQNRDRNAKLKKVIDETKRHMMIVLIMGFLFTIILALVVPGKIALPFKKIKDAIRELQDCNYDVSIYYSQDDEIGEIASEMNKMIHNMKVFEELRADRISVENRKFDALANLVKKPILVANAASRLMYMNSKMYSILQCQTEQVINKEMSTTPIPASIIEGYELAIKRRSKIENIEVLIPKPETEITVITDVTDTEAELEDDDDVITEVVPKVKPKEVEYAFRGYATIIPIRGKDSSLDYYLMVLSTKVIS